MSVLIVTGTGTGVGKTVATASVAALALARGERVAVVKPAQTGLAPEEPGDVAEIVRLAGLDAADGFEVTRFPDPLAPATAARVASLPPVSIDACADLVGRLATSYDLVLVEGAGGLLVRLSDDARGVTTLADLAALVTAPLLVVTGAGLGTLNSTALTLEAMERRGLGLSGLLIGCWPADPDLASRTNVDDLEILAGRPLAGALPEGMGSLAPGAFAAAASAAVGPGLGGAFDAADFRRSNSTDSSRANRSSADSREQP